MTEIHDSLSYSFIYVLQADEVFHRFSNYKHILNSFFFFLFNFVFIVILFLSLSSTHVIEKGYLDAQHRFVTLFELDHVLAFDTVISCNKESLNSFACKFFLLFVLSEVIMDFLICSFIQAFKIPWIISAQTSIINQSKLSFNSQQTWVLLVPECFDRKSVWGHFVFYEFIHVNVVNVELCIWYPDTGERNLVTQDG